MVHGVVFYFSFGHFFQLANGWSSNKKWHWPGVGVLEQAAALAAAPGPPAPWGLGGRMQHASRRRTGRPQLAGGRRPDHHRRRKQDLGLG
jgi:hypothetical protein